MNKILSFLQICIHLITSNSLSSENMLIEKLSKKAGRQRNTSLLPEAFPNICTFQFCISSWTLSSCSKQISLLEDNKGYLLIGYKARRKSQDPEIVTTKKMSVSFCFITQQSSRNDLEFQDLRVPGWKSRLSEGLVRRIISK